MSILKIVRYVKENSEQSEEELLKSIEEILNVRSPEITLKTSYNKPSIINSLSMLNYDTDLGSEVADQFRKDRLPNSSGIYKEDFLKGSQTYMALEKLEDNKYKPRINHMDHVWYPQIHREKENYL